MLQEADVRAMVRLLGEVAALRGDLPAKKHYLMDGLCELIGADSWVWALTCDSAVDRDSACVAFLHGGCDAAVARIDGSVIDDFRRSTTHLTPLLEPVDVKRRSSPRHPLHSTAQIGPSIISRRAVGENARAAIGIYRATEKPIFTRRECRIAHIILSEVPWLYEQGSGDDRAAPVPQLSPRARLTLNLLLEGRSRKEIADHLDISVNTVAGYVKDVYKHFGVRSHAELMGRFLHGDGGDLPLTTDQAKHDGGCGATR